MLMMIKSLRKCEYVLNVFQQVVFLQHGSRVRSLVLSSDSDFCMSVLVSSYLPKNMQVYEMLNGL